MLDHELRTPLNAITGYAEAMSLGVFGPLPAPYDTHAAIIHRAALHLQALIEAPSGPRAPVAFEPGAVAGEILALLEPRAVAGGVTVSLTQRAEPADIPGDPVAYRQILLNLLDNALKFTASGGAIAVTLDRSAEWVTILVTDSGGGAGPAGSGRGLDIVRSLCADQGGTMDFTHPTSLGATVSVRLPMRTEPPPS